MSDLVEFLRARLDEDEIAAKAAQESAEGGEWAMDGAGPVRAGVGSTLVDAGTPYINRHIARHDPARILREVEAKRLRVALAVDMLTGNHPKVGAGDERSKLVHEGIRVGSQAVAEAVLKSEAHVYADHEDFNPRWAV
jgi:hypothetical protein